MRRGRRLVVALQAALAAGCSPGARPPAVPLATGVAVRLLDPGQAPRAQLRHDPAGGTETLIVELSSTVTLAVGELAPPQVHSPTVRLTLVLRPRRDSASRLLVEGSVDRVETLAGPSVDLAVVRAVAADLEPLAGTRLVAAYSPSGLLESAELPGTQTGQTIQTTPQLVTIISRLRDALRLLLPPVPDEEVGYGARWEVRGRAPVGAGPAVELAEYTLAGWTTGSARLTVRMTLTGGQQTLDVPGLPPGARVTFQTVQGGGHGTTVLHRGRLVHPSERHWSSSASGTSQPAGEPPATFQLSATFGTVLRAP